MKTYVQGGYVTITVGQFANVCEARKSGRISFLGLRVWLACHEQRAKRCTAKTPVRFGDDARDVKPVAVRHELHRKLLHEALYADGFVAMFRSLLHRLSLQTGMTQRWEIVLCRHNLPKA